MLGQLHERRQVGLLAFSHLGQLLEPPWADASGRGHCWLHHLDWQELGPPFALDDVAKANMRLDGEHPVNDLAYAGQVDAVCVEPPADCLVLDWAGAVPVPDQEPVAERGGRHQVRVGARQLLCVAEARLTAGPSTLGREARHDRPQELRLHSWIRAEVQSCARRFKTAAPT